MSENEFPTIVIDNGSGMMKVGFAGDEEPRSVLPSVVGEQKYNQKNDEGSNKETFIGNEAYAKSENLNLKYPIEHGIVNNWDDIEKIWNHAFYNELRVDPKNTPF
jgi:actin-related protein